MLNKRNENTCRLARRALLPPSVCPCISKHSAPANGGEIGAIRAITFAGFSEINSRPNSERDRFFRSKASSRPPSVYFKQKKTFSLMFFYEHKTKIRTSRTFQRSNNNFRMGNGGDGALQNAQTA